MKKRVFSGLKPTGNIHIGNYLGALKNWLTMQDEYDCIYSIVDLHAMTVEYDPIDLKANIFKAACNYLACGLDPNKSIIMVQSSVKYHAELCWILNCLTPVSWLERVPTYKDMSLNQNENINFGLLGYPVLQTADIILYKAEAVPIGEDQLPHIEIGREILRRFNHRFGETFPEIKGIVGKGARIKGLDNTAKMSKSLGDQNCIYLFEDKETIWKKLATAVTDTARMKKTDAGNPEVCNLYSYHLLFSNQDDLIKIENGCKYAEIGCLQCKKILFENMNNELEPIRTKYHDFLDNPDLVYDILNDGNKRANNIAKSTMEIIYDKIGLIYDKKND